MVDIQVIGDDIVFDRTVVAEIKMKNNGMRHRFVDAIKQLDSLCEIPGDESIELMAATDQALDRFTLQLLEFAKLYDDISITRLKQCLRQAREEI